MYTKRCDDEGNLVCLTRTSDGAAIPPVACNRDYERFLADGGMARPDLRFADLSGQKRMKRDAVNAEAQRRILAKWPLTIQSSINAGLYPALAAPMADEIALIVDESNRACDYLFSLTDLDAVRAYDPATDPGWSDIGVYSSEEPV